MYLKSMTKTCCNVRYKVIFTEIKMPLMDGITAAKKIKEIEASLFNLQANIQRVHITMITSLDELKVKQ